MAWASQDPFFWLFRWYLNVFHLVKKYSSKVLRYNWKKYLKIFCRKAGHFIHWPRWGTFPPPCMQWQLCGSETLLGAKIVVSLKLELLFPGCREKWRFLVRQAASSCQNSQGDGVWGGFYLQGSRDKLLLSHRGGIAALEDTHQWRSQFLYWQLSPHPWWKKRGRSVLFKKLGVFFPLFMCVLRTGSWKAWSEHLRDKWEEICPVKSSSSSFSAFLSGEAATEKSLPRRDYLPESLLQAWQALKCLL